MKRDTAMNWAASNPVIPLNEIAYETDTGIFKVGDGSTRYAYLAAAGRENIGNEESQDATIAGLTQTCQQITNSGEITGFVVLTQAEYDALPASKLTDGKVYLVEEE